MYKVGLRALWWGLDDVGGGASVERVEWGQRSLDPGFSLFLVFKFNHLHHLRLQARKVNQ